MPGSSTLIGRAAELRRLVEVADAVASGEASCRFVVVAGEAGIGKTRLVDELTAAVAPRIRVLRGRADEHDAAAFGLWLPMLAQLGLPRPGTDASVSASEQRWDVVDLLASALPAPALLVLEDLHWADDVSLWVLEQLLDRCSDRAVAVVATTRPSSETRVPRWHALYRRGEVVALDGLDAGEVADLVSQLGSPSSDARGLWERTGGNPLFVREQILSRRDTASTSIESLLASTIEQLGPETAGIVSLIAVAGPATPRPVLAAAAAMGPGELDRRVDDATRADILRPDGDSIRFRHDLLAEAAARRVDSQAGTILHVALADAHAEVGGADADHAEARHRLLAVPTVDPTAAAERALATADRLRASGLAAEAAALLHLAGEVVVGRGGVDPVVQARVAVAEADARWALDDYDGARAASARAVELATVAGDPVVAAQAQVAATIHHNPFVPDHAALERLATLDELLHDDDSVDPALRIRLRGRRSMLTLTVPDRADEAVALADDAVARARVLGDPDVLVAALSDRLFVLRTPDDYVARGLAAAEIVQLAQTTGRTELARLGHEWTWATRTYEGDLTGAIVALDNLELLAAIMPSPLWRYGVAVRRASVLAFLGDYEGALAVATSSRVLASSVVDEHEAAGLELSMRALPALLYGRDDHGIEPVLARVVELIGDVPVLFIQAMTAAPEAILGDLASARRRVAPWLGRFHVAFDGIEGLSLLGILAHLAVILRWREAAEELHRLLAPFAGRMTGGNGAALDLSADHHLGALALVMDDVPTSLHHAKDAVVFARRMRSPVLEARALALLASVNERLGDRTASASAADAAATIAEPLGMRLPELREARAPRAGRAPSTRGVSLRLDGGRWFVQSPFGDGHVADSAGMKQLVQLVLSPSTEIAAVDLAGATSGQPFAVSSDLGAALDARAKREYRQRISELQAEIDEADANNDSERAAKHRIELDAILDQLRAAVGIGGRDRPQGSGSERARVNAARNIRRAIAAIARELPDLGAHLEVSIRTGYRCAYTPEPAAALTWTVERTS